MITRQIIIFFLLFCTCDCLAEVYLTKEQALEVVLGKEVEKTYLPKQLTNEILQELKKQNLLDLEMKTAHFFISKKDEKIIGYALIDQEIGKHLPITYIVGISPEGSISKLELMVFREVRGWEVREKRFLQQFENKTIKDSLQIGETLKNVTGATLSAKALAKGSKRALLLWQYFFEYKPKS